MKAKIVQFILDNFDNSTSSEIVRCLNKATIIMYDNRSVIIADDNYVYYFGSTLNPKDTVSWYRTYKHLLSGKKSYTTNPKILKVMAKEIIGMSKSGNWEYILK
jgi:hypothetical protein